VHSSGKIVTPQTNAQFLQVGCPACCPTISVGAHFLIFVIFIYEVHSINKLQNGAIPLILKIGKIRNYTFCRYLILKIHRNFVVDDVIIVTSSVHRTQSICVLFSPPVFYHNSQVLNSIGTTEKRISLTS